MRVAKAITFGLVGAATMSAVSAVLRATGVPIQMEMILGTLTGLPPGTNAFMVGLLIHLTLGAIFGVIYGALFEHVWNHGGASTGMILSVLHASLIGMAFGLMSRFHPHMPMSVRDPGPYFANIGVVGVVAFFALHIIYGAIVGGGYGHVVTEHEWAPEGRL